MATPPANSEASILHNQSGWLNERRERAIRWVMIAFFAVMATGYNLGPILEGPDELQHYYYIRYLLTTDNLPDRTAEYHPERWEFHQAPLYYVLGALIRLPFPDSDFDQLQLQRNIFFEWDREQIDFGGLPRPGNFNKNMILHSSAEDFPYFGSETALVTHLLRLYSTVLGVLTVLICAAMFRLLWPNQPASRLLALGIVCSWPHFQYLSGIVNNDNLATLAITVCVYLSLRMLSLGATRSIAILIGLAFGAALLAKANGVLVALPIATAYSFSGRQNWRKGLLSMAVALAVAGWWYVRNTIYYGDPSGLRAQYTMMPDLVPTDGHVPLVEMPGRWLAAYRTMWGSFGAVNSIPLPNVVSTIYNLLVVAAAVGLIVGAIRFWRGYRKTRVLASGEKQAAVVVLLGTAWIAGITYYMYTNMQGWYGRLLLPGISAWSAGLAVGLIASIPERFQLRVATAGTALMALLAVFALATFHAAYRPSPMPAQIESERDLTYDHIVQLVGVSNDTINAHPGGSAEFTLYWRSLKSTSRVVIIDIHTYGEGLIALTTYPGTGNWPATVWQPDQYWAEHYSIKIPGTTEPGHSVPILVFLLYSDDSSLLPILGPGNAPLMFPAVMQLRIEP